MNRDQRSAAMTTLARLVLSAALAVVIAAFAGPPGGSGHAAGTPSLAPLSHAAQNVVGSAVSRATVEVAATRPGAGSGGAPPPFSHALLPPTPFTLAPSLVALASIEAPPRAHLAAHASQTFPRGPVSRGPPARA
jgi:hypothetical protein